MKRYLRPLGLLSGATASEATEAGLALPLAGGTLAYALVEVIERSESRIERRIVAVGDGRFGSLRVGAPEASPPPNPADRGEGMRNEASETLPPDGGGLGGGAARARKPLVMGVVNVTPDSFSDGGDFLDARRAIRHAEAMLRAGAAIIDIGGESTRPGALPVDSAEEIRRVVPVIAGIRTSAEAAGAVISIDTRNAATMRAALEAGVGMINDVSALTHDPAAVGVVTTSDATVVLMHMQGGPRTMQVAPAYVDVVLDIYDYLEARIAACEAAGIDRARIIVDPGIGFGKTVVHNLQLLSQLSLFHGLGLPILIGVSRKGFVAHLAEGEASGRRLPGSLAAGLVALSQGAQILRVHDVTETVQAVRIAEAIAEG